MEREGGRVKGGEIDRGRVKKAIGRMKDGKAEGADGIPGEVWKYGGEEMEEWIWEVCNGVWMGRGWPEGWKEGLVIPIRKKGEGKEVGDYRGITLLPTLYKIYATVLAEEIGEEVEKKGILTRNQIGFRKGVGTVDGIYVLNYLINRRVEEKGKLVGLFVDLRAAFDAVNKGILEREMRRRGVKEDLVERVEKVLRDTRNRVRIGRESGDMFWTGRGVRQGCPLSPVLFNCLVAELEEYMRKGCWGELGWEKRRCIR